MTASSSIRGGGPERRAARWTPSRGGRCAWRRWPEDQLTVLRRRPRPRREELHLDGLSTQAAEPPANPGAVQPGRVTSSFAPCYPPCYPTGTHRTPPDITKGPERAL